MSRSDSSQAANSTGFFCLFFAWVALLGEKGEWGVGSGRGTFFVHTENTLFFARRRKRHSENFRTPGSPSEFTPDDPE